MTPGSGGFYSRLRNNQTWTQLSCCEPGSSRTEGESHLRGTEAASGSSSDDRSKNLNIFYDLTDKQRLTSRAGTSSVRRLDPETEAGISDRNHRAPQGPSGEVNISLHVQDSSKVMQELLHSSMFVVSSDKRLSLASGDEDEFRLESHSCRSLTPQQIKTPARKQKTK